ncbi:MAG: hypothetical protein WCA64_12790 [Gallionella sp.]
MLELTIYYYGVLRYTIIGDLDKLRELQSLGYYVQVNQALRSQKGSSLVNRNEPNFSIENSHLFAGHDDGMNKLADERPNDGIYTLDFG